MKILISLVGVAFVGFRIAFNSAAMLGNNAVAILYNGVRSICGLPVIRLGIVAVMAVLFGVPIIQFVSEIMKNSILVHIKVDK